MAINQTSFKEGQSGNPKGRPKRGWTWSGVLEKAVEKVENEETGQTVKEVVAESLIKEAKRGNVIAQKELMNRMDGMPQQDIKQTGNVILNVKMIRDERKRTIPTRDGV